MKILLADDHDLVRDTLVAYFERDSDFEVTEANDFETAEKAIKVLGPFGLILLDYSMPGMDGLRGLQKAIDLSDGTPVAIISGTADVTVANPLAEKLTKRELEVLVGLSQGLSNKEIARNTDLQEVTIKLHVKTLCRKLEARNRTHAAMIARDADIV